MIEQLKMHIPAKGRPTQLSIKDQIFLCLVLDVNTEHCSILQQVMVCQN